MGICSSQQKINGIIDNQSQYEIIYHVSGSKRQMAEFEKQINVGPKVGVGPNKLQLQGMNFHQRQFSKPLKYQSEVRIPPHSFSSFGLNKIQAGCFLSIYATRTDEKGKKIFKKLIFKDIYVRTNQDVCLRIYKDFKYKQLDIQEIQEMKQRLAIEGSTTISTVKKKTGKLKNKKEDTQQLSTKFYKNTDYLKQIFGSKYLDHYLQQKDTGLYDLNHSKVKVNMKLFLNYDWTSLQILQLDYCGINNKDWKMLCVAAPTLFQNIKQIWLAGNKISTITKEDLQRFPSLEMIQLDYSQTEGVNPLTKDSKAQIVSFQLQHPDVLFFCATINQNEQLDIDGQEQERKDIEKQFKQMRQIEQFMRKEFKEMDQNINNQKQKNYKPVEQGVPKKQNQYKTILAKQQFTYPNQIFYKGLQPTFNPEGIHEKNQYQAQQRGNRQKNQKQNIFKGTNQDRIRQLQKAQNFQIRKKIIANALNQPIQQQITIQTMSAQTQKPKKDAFLILNPATNTARRQRKEARKLQNM